MNGLHPLPSSGQFLFSPKPATGHSVASAELPAYTAPDALSQIEKLSGCSVIKLLRISSDDEDENEDVVLYNSQLRVALAELLGIHHEQAKQVRQNSFTAWLRWMVAVTCRYSVGRSGTCAGCQHASHYPTAIP